MQDARVDVGTDEAVYGEDEELIVWCRRFKGMPDVDGILVVGVKDDLGEVVMVIKDGTRDGEGFIIKDVVGLPFLRDVALECKVEFREPVGHAVEAGIRETDSRTGCVLRRVPGDTPQEEDAIRSASMLGEPQQLITNGIIDADRCHQTGFVGHFRVDGR